MNISCNSDNLVHYKEIFEYMDSSVIVMEYCDFGDLEQVLDNGKNFTEEVYLYSYLYLCLYLYLSFLF
jgi:serine/threonine protein kinase